MTCFFSLSIFRRSCMVISGIFLCSCVSIIDATTSKPIEEDPGERSMGSSLDDSHIETVIAVNLRKADPALREAHIDVTSYNGVVLLTGQVASDDNRSAASDVANRVKRVRQVHNELSVSGATSILARSNDSWLTTKIKTKLLFTANLNSGHIKVITENGVIYLMGLTTRAEADTAVDVARNTSGVQIVVRVFEYLE